MFGLTQLMMRKTEIGAASDQIHPRLQSEEPTGGMTRLARQAGQPFAKGGIQALDKSRVEDRAPLRALEQLLRLHQHPMGHLPRDLDHPLFLGVLDDRPNVQLWPDLQTRSSDSMSLFDFLSECSANTVGIGSPPVCHHEQREHRGRTSAHVLEQLVSQAAITRAPDHACYPQARRNHHGQSHPDDHLASFHPNAHRLERAQGPVALVQ